MKQSILKSLGLLVMLCLFVCLSSCKKEYIHVGENWDYIHKLKKPENTFSVSVTGKSSARLGDELSYTVTSEKSGNLWVVQVDPEDTLSLLFPNDIEQDNHIYADRPLTVPPKDGSWSIQASEPAGESVVVFVVTTGEVEINDVLEVQNSMEKAISIVRKTPSWGFARKVVEIK